MRTVAVCCLTIRLTICSTMGELHTRPVECSAVQCSTARPVTSKKPKTVTSVQLTSTDMLYYGGRRLHSHRAARRGGRCCGGCRDFIQLCSLPAQTCSTMGELHSHSAARRGGRCCGGCRGKRNAAQRSAARRRRPLLLLLLWLGVAACGVCREHSERGKNSVTSEA